MILPILRATRRDVGPLARVISDAFIDLTPSVWLVEDPQTRARIFPDYFALYLELGIQDGTVLTTPERQAVAIWLPVTPDTMPSLPDHDIRLATIAGPLVEQFHAFDATLDKHHPTTPPHDWLAILAVAPRWQGHGLGTELLNHYHRILDVQHQYAYLEAANARDRDFYQQRGWYCLDEPFRLPDDGPPMWPMMRPPGGGR